LIGKLIADRFVAKEVLRAPLLRAWKLRVLCLLEIWATIFFWQILNMSGINLGYWKGDRGCLMVTWSPLVNMLPLACMGKEIGIKIGSSVGLVEEIDIFDDEVGWGEYLRICVLLDLQKPLARGRKLHFQNMQIYLGSFQI
jgi:hypothetical protein